MVKQLSNPQVETQRIKEQLAYGTGEETPIFRIFNEKLKSSIYNKELNDNFGLNAIESTVWTSSSVTSANSYATIASGGSLTSIDTFKYRSSEFRNLYFSSTPIASNGQNTWGFYNNASNYILFMASGSSVYALSNNDSGSEETLLSGVSPTTATNYKIVWRDITPTARDIGFFVNDSLKTNHTTYATASSCNVRLNSHGYNLNTDRVSAYTKPVIARSSITLADSFILGHSTFGILGTSKLGITQSSFGIQFEADETALTTGGLNEIRDELTGSDGDAPLYLAVASNSQTVVNSMTSITGEIGTRLTTSSTDVTTDTEGVQRFKVDRVNTVLASNQNISSAAHFTAAADGTLFTAFNHEIITKDGSHEYYYHIRFVEENS